MYAVPETTAIKRMSIENPVITRVPILMSDILSIGKPPPFPEDVLSPPG
jgi:hypothetical protein